MNEYITMRDCLKLDLKDAIAQRDNLTDQRDFAISEMERLEEERDEAREECLEQANLLAMFADREEILLQQIAALKSQISNLQSP